jgi:hypothetical protein
VKGFLFFPAYIIAIMYQLYYMPSQYYLFII